MKKLNIDKVTALWILIVLAVFIMNIILGILMRFSQGEVLEQSPVTFYSNMTTHGLSMIAIWFVAGMAAVHFLLSRYVKQNIKANVIAMICTLIGASMLWTSTFIGKFHTGWTFLYPLPLHIAWEKWATPLFLIALTVLGSGWLIWAVSLTFQILKKYPLTIALGWQHFKKQPKAETPPFILISIVSLSGVIACLFAAVILLALYFIEYFSDRAIINDALLMKNLTFFFGHTLANEMLYLGLAVIYELFPNVSGTPKWRTTWYVALAWNCTLIFILTAFFHHLFMDFVQPESFQIVGQIASYLSSLPAAAVTTFTILTAIYKTKIQWSVSNILFIIGICGWVIGGIAAIIDATISNNFTLHNTLWVPAHFHTYNAMGNVLFSLGFFFWFTTHDSPSLAQKNNRMKLMLLIIGGAGFLLAFYLAGAMSVPRRFNIYPEEFSMATTLAVAGGSFAILYLFAILIFFLSISKKCIRILFSSSV